MRTFRTILASVGAALLVTGSALAQANNSSQITLRNNGTGIDAGSVTLTFGVNTGATNNGFDAALGEKEAPPAPPSAIFDARWVNVTTGNGYGEGLLDSNYRFSSSPTQRDTFKLKFQSGDGGVPITITWPANLSTRFGSANLKVGTDNVNMLTSSSYSLTDPDVVNATITTSNPTAPAVGGVTAAPSPLNFGTVLLPTPGTKTDSITVTNGGATNARIDSIRTTSGNFIVSIPPSFPATLAPGASVKFGVRFLPAGSGSYSGIVRIYHNQAGSPIAVTVTALASTGEGLYFNTVMHHVMDNRTDVYKDTIGLQYNGGTPVQGIQFKITSPNTTLKIKKVELGSAITNPLDWNFDYEVTNAASGSEALVILYGHDTTKNLPTGNYPNLFRVTYDVKNIRICDGALGGDTLNAIMYLNSPQSSLATNLGQTAGVGIDGNRDSASYTIHNSSGRGDVNCDDRVDVLDILETIDVILGRQTFAPWQFNRADLAPWSSSWTPAGAQIFSDANNYGDHQVNVQDVVLIANAILNEDWPDGIQLFSVKGNNPGGEAYDLPVAGIMGGSSVYDVKFQYLITRNGIDVVMDNLVPVKGIQMKLKAVDAPADLDAQLNSALAGKFTIQKVVDTDKGEIRILIYSLSGDVINVNKERLMQILYPVKNPSAFAVIEPIIVGGADNKGVKVEYEVTNTSGVDREESAKAFALQSLPNPFSGTTEIRYTLRNASNVSLVITDVRGAEVARVLDNKLQNAGDHVVEFNAIGSGLASGSYFCTLNAEGASTSLKMIVIAK
ncbi:MAG: choice-of-anchor D domain-containing protein [Candidatus Kapaibacterium sp.]